MSDAASLPSSCVCLIICMTRPLSVVFLSTVLTVVFVVHVAPWSSGRSSGCGARRRAQEGPADEIGELPSHELKEGAGGGDCAACLEACRAGNGCYRAASTGSTWPASTRGCPRAAGVPYVAPRWWPERRRDGRCCHRGDRDRKIARLPSVSRVAALVFYIIYIAAKCVEFGALVLLSLCLQRFACTALVM
jgi:hypothetical protein